MKNPRKREADEAAEGDGFYAAYAEYSKILRTWFVAYGVGGPVLFVTQDRIASVIAKSGEARCIVVLFLVGVALQIMIAMVNKYCNWLMYYWTYPEDRTWPRMYAFVDKFTEQFWIDILIDLGTAAAMGWATVKTVMLFA